MIEAVLLHTSATGPRSRSKPSALRAAAIRVVESLPTGIASQGTELIAMQTWPPSWSVAAISRCRVAPRTPATNSAIAAGESALWLRLTTRRPPNWRCFQSASTASVSGPWKPAMITAPTSSSRVNPPGPSWTAEVGLATGFGIGDGFAATPPPAQETTSSAR